MLKAHVCGRFLIFPNFNNKRINMSRQIQIRRGSATDHASFTGAIGEITMDTTNKTLRVHDGSTVGGTILAKQSEIPTVTYKMPDYSSGTAITLGANNTYTATYDQVLICNVGWGSSGNSELIIMRNSTDTLTITNLLLAINLSNYACASNTLYLKSGDSIYIKSRTNAVSIVAYPLN